MWLPLRWDGYCSVRNIIHSCGCGCYGYVVAVQGERECVFSWNFSRSAQLVHAFNFIYCCHRAWCRPANKNDSSFWACKLHFTRFFPPSPSRQYYYYLRTLVHVSRASTYTAAENGIAFANKSITGTSSARKQCARRMCFFFRRCSSCFCISFKCILLTVKSWIVPLWMHVQFYDSGERWWRGVERMYNCTCNAEWNCQIFVMILKVVV